MPTGQVIISNALTSLNILEQGGVPNASDSADALVELNDMWDAAGIDEGLIYAIIPFQGKLVANQGAYNIGSGAQFDTARPARIYKAFVVRAVSFAAGTTGASAVITAVSTTGLYIGQSVVGAGVPQGAVILSISTNVSITISANATATAAVTLLAGGNDRNPLDIIEALKYYSKNDLGATAQTPQELYPDYNADANGFGRLYLWPIPLLVDPGFLELDSAVTFSAWALGTNYNIPQGYRDWLNYGLASRLLPRYGAAVDKSIAEYVMMRAEKAEARLRAANAFNRRLPPEAMGLAAPAKEA